MSPRAHSHSRSRAQRASASPRERTSPRATTRRAGKSAKPTAKPSAKPTAKPARRPATTSGPARRATGATQAKASTKPSRLRRRRAGPVRARSQASGDRTKRKPSGTTSPASRRARRSRRVPLAVATVVALVIVGTSFPASALLSQHHQLASADAQLARVQHQNALLAEQEQQLNNKTEIQRLARQEYQLVLPGQSLFNVLPADGQPVATGGGTSSLGDPGSQPLVSPSNAPDMTPDPGNPTSDATGTSTGTSPTTTTTPTSSGASVGGFWHRVSTTLEFWK